MPPRLKRVGTGTHDRSNNHQAGLAAPGRRITKQKSSTSLNGPHQTTPNGRRSIPDVDVDALPTPTNTSSTDAAPPPSDAPANDPANDDAKMGAGQSQSDGRARSGSGASDADLEAHGSCNGTFGRVNGSPLTIDVKAAGRSCPLPHQKSMFATATTILRACPLWDVIAILIILLQLPPTIVSVVQFLFALLTFVPPVGGTSLANLPSLNEVLVGASGVPSFQTIVLLDTVMFIIYVCVPWTPAQNLALDLAQMVIAISLGGAAASSGGTSNSIFCCLSIIGFSHLLRMQFARQLGLNAIWNALARSGFRPASGPPSIADFPDKLHASHGWPRKLLGVHILTQGVVRLVRRWYLYSAAMNELSVNKKVDPETGAFSALSTPRTTTSSLGDSGPDMTGTSSSDGRPPGPSPAAREKDRISNSKKKKKQANHVRSQQPFWAAVANAKVTFLKELEQQQASMDSVEANSMDAANIGNADFKNGKDRVWIKEVGATEISFGVCLLNKTLHDEDDDNEPDTTSTAKRFRLRLNRTDWSSTRINSENLGMSVGEWQVDEWSAKIFGLTPSTNYICEFIRAEEDGAVFCTMHLTTGTAPSTEQAPAPPAAQTQSLRPLSPKTTLKNSIQAAEQQLEAQRNRLKRNKRDHKNTLTGLQKDVDSLRSRLDNHGGNDDRLRQKARQLEQSLQQAKARESETFTQIDELGHLPADEMEAASRQRASWRHEKERLSAARQAYEESKGEADREVSQAKADLTSLRQKHQKFEQRQTKYNEQHSRLVAETSQSQEAQARRFHEHDSLLYARSEEERRYLEQTALCDREAHASWSRGVQADTESKHLEELFTRNLQQQSVPTTPEGPLPGTRTLHHGQTTFPPLQPAFQFPHPAFNDGSNPLSLYREKRGRSSSMLSGVSGFTDDLDDDTFPLGKHQVTFAPGNGGVIGNGRRKSSAGSGASGSSGSGQSSTRDPLSPPPTSVGLTMGGSPLSPPPHVAR